MSVEAELQKLSHQTGVPVEELDFLSGLPAQDLRTLRAQIGEALFLADRHYFVKVAGLSKSIPAAIAAKVTEFALPPLIAARTAELLDPAKAVDLVGRISGGYLARVASAMDPSRSPHVIEKIPPDKIALVGRELAAKREWVVIGGFVSYVTPAGLRASVAEFDGEQLLRVGFVLEDTSRLGEITAMLTDRQVDELLRAAGEHGLWQELEELLSHIDDEQAARLRSRLAVSDAAAAALREAAGTGQLSPAGASKLGLEPRR